MTQQQAYQSALFYNDNQWAIFMATGSLPTFKTMYYFLEIPKF